MNPHLLPFRVFCEGTLDPVEIAHALMPTVRAVLGENCATHRDLQSVIDADGAGEDSAESIQDALDLLQEYAPAFCSVGAHPDDGACLGVWPCVESAMDDEDVLRVNDTSEIPADYVGHVLHVNERGNATLYEAHGVDPNDSESAMLVEIWGVV